MQTDFHNYVKIQITSKLWTVVALNNTAHFTLKGVERRIEYCVLLLRFNMLQMLLPLLHTESFYSCFLYITYDEYNAIELVCKYYNCMHTYLRHFHSVSRLIIPPMMKGYSDNILIHNTARTEILPQKVQ